MQAAAKAKQKKLARSMTTTHALFSSHLARSSGAPRFSGTTRRPISPASRTGSANAALLVHQSSLGSYSDSKLASGSTSRRTGTPNSARQPAAGTTRKLAAPGGSSQTGPRRKLQLDSAGSGLFNPTMASDGQASPHALVQQLSQLAELLQAESIRQSMDGAPPASGPDAASQAQPSEEYADSGVSPRSTQDLLMTIEAQGERRAG
ncbi:hypothetical protein WJX72_005252 [[Myrmecia] bisecta]|uniref:Uncharacterized protein n=1 Tax=[Myrmecia] bisecta TaxID=41462 RepID=A0AAW1QF11_9CHLO